MLIKKAGFVAATFLQTTAAFFPWFPDYRCVEDHTCITSKRALEANVERSGGETTVSIVQSLPQDGLPHDVQVRQLAERLMRKYHRKGEVLPSSVQGRHVDKRTNEYKVVTAETPTQTDSAGIHQDGTDFSYFATVKLGSKGTPMYMLLDTGAGTSWVMGHSCTSDPCKSHNAFGPEDSTTFKPTGSGFSIMYGSGTVKGVMTQDTLSIAGIDLPATFGIANETSNDFNSFPIDGILGLSQAKGPNPTFMESLVASKVLKSNMFGVGLSRSADGGPNNGVINFGAVDKTQFTGSLAYSKVNENTEGDWAIQLDDIAFGDKLAGIDDKLAYIDTGTSYIFAPENDVKKFHAVVADATSADGITYTVPCDTTADIAFNFGQSSFKVSSKDWVGPKTGDKCTSNIYGYAVVEGAWLLGDTFLKNVYSVFDLDQNRVGFAPRATAPVSLSTTTSSTGAPTSLTTSSPSEPLGSGSTAAGSSSSLTQSDGTQIVSSSGSANPSITAPMGEATSASTTGQPGLNGHQTSGSASTAPVAADGSTPSESPAGQSTGSRVDIKLGCAFFTALALFLLA